MSRQAGDGERAGQRGRRQRCREREERAPARRLSVPRAPVGTAVMRSILAAIAGSRIGAVRSSDVVFPHIRRSPWAVVAGFPAPIRVLYRRCGRTASLCWLHEQYRVVVVGNGVSGYACAARLAEPGVPVTMIGPGLPHDRPPLSKRSLLTGRVPLLADAAQLVERGIEHVDGVVTDVRPRPPPPRRPALGRRGGSRDRGADARLGDRSPVPAASGSRASTWPRKTPPAPVSISLSRQLGRSGAGGSS